MKLRNLLPSFFTPANRHVQLAKFPQGRRAAVSFTFDDGAISQYELGAAILEEFGFRGTFFVVADWAGKPNRMSWDHCRQAVARGHEIGCHTWSHPKGLAELAGDDLHREVVEAGEEIARQTGVKPTSFCFPFNDYNDRLANFVLQHYQTARGPTLLPATMVDYDGKDFLAADANRWASQALEEKRWLVPVLHLLEEGTDWEYRYTLDSNVLKQHLEFLKSKQDEVWVDTFAAVSRYLQQVQLSKIRRLSVRDHEVAFHLTCSLPGKTPLTVEVATPAPERTKAWQGAQELSVHAGKDLVRIDVVAGKEPIRVAWN